MLQYIILVFGAVTCARAASVFGRGRSYDASFANDDDKIFARAPPTKSIPRQLAPFYYVSYDLYQNTCFTERCDDVAELFLKSVTKSTEPCDDFLGYACGNNPSKTRPLITEIQEILELPIANKDMKSLALEKKLYRSCMEQPEASDFRTRREFTRLLELSNGTNLFIPGKKFGGIDWQLIDSFYAALGFEHAFFNVHVMRDPTKSDVNTIALMPPSPLYFYSMHGMLKYKNFSAVVSNLLMDYDKINPYVADYEDVIDFNNALHEILPPLGMFEENITTLINNRMTVRQWRNFYNSAAEALSIERQYETNHIYWLKMINTLLKSANFRISMSDHIVVKNIKYFTKLAQLLEKTSSSTVEKYIHFKFLTQISKYLNPSLARFFENIQDRSSFCIKQSDNQLVGATYEYIKKYVPHEQKIHAEKIMDNIRNALINLLLNANWMDNETKSYGIRKLKNLDMTIGYPDWQINESFVNNYYGNLHLHLNFFENIIKYKRRTLLHELYGLKYPKIYDPSTMSKKLTPLIYHFEVNSHMHRILFPTEYLNEKKYKLFSPQLPSTVNYGSFGSMLGSILYDYVSLTDNLKYNEFYTRTVEGLSKDTIDAYKVKEKCLTNQLTKYKKSALNFDQPLAAVIDRDTIQVDKIYEKMTGLRAAFEAYKTVESEKDELLPGFENMSNYQLFFLSYAERICEIGDIYDKYDAYETSLKVNGVVSNLPAFSEVFQCLQQSPMNGETKCELFS